ncbi:DUF4148 domain-containing protein [Trinickia mobilis]|uniref:DUF4148 domain-containing protein n=1 Tax=Trinickia mobilis TaxID=2816356 RepID=UPI001A8E6E2C|nr:DUF4148 domain-containing protein [Trinickia mobilis]
MKKNLARLTLGIVLGTACLASASSALSQTATSRYDPAAPKTRAEVIADLVAWRAAGYDPLDWLNYPCNAQRAGRIVAQQRAQRSAQ